MTNRTEITKALGDLLRVHKFGGIGKYWASEVSIDPWAKKGKEIGRASCRERV